jgi:hypothetical protein
MSHEKRTQFGFIPRDCNGKKERKKGGKKEKKCNINLIIKWVKEREKNFLVFW